jgi:hypothetical protein
MESWILVMLVFAGALSKGDSVALQTIPGFDSKARCEAAGRDLDPLVKNSFKDVRFVCVRK